MKSWIALAAVFLATSATAQSYHIVLDKPAAGTLIKGHGGLHAADERTATTHVRVIAPGNNVDERGTVRVLVVNLGAHPFEVGPDEVTVRLGDGTVLKPTPVEAMEKGRTRVERESRRAAIIDRVNRNNLSSFAGQTTGGSAPVPAVRAPGADAAPQGGGQEYQRDPLLVPGGGLLDAIDQVLVPLDVGPGEAWGGYYLFDVPEAIRRQRTDLPLSIVIRTGAEEHHFSGRLRRK